MSKNLTQFLASYVADFPEAEHLLREHEELLEAAKAADEYAFIVQDALDRSTRHEMNAGELGMIANLWDEKRTTLRAAIAKAVRKNF